MTRVMIAPTEPGPPPAHDAWGRDDGVILVAVIWMLVLLGGLVTVMSLYTTSVVSTIDTFSDRPKADAALEAGVNRAAAQILSSPPPALQGAGEAPLGEARIAFDWTAETARIDINYASADLLAGLFLRLGAERNEAASAAGVIVGLRGLPSAPPVQAPGQPRAYDYSVETPAGIAAAAHRLDPKPDAHAPFVDVAQLEQVPGLPPGLMSRAAPFLTVYNGAPEIDARVAAPEIIEALPDMTRERARSLFAMRRGDPTFAGLDDALGPSNKPLTTTKPSLAFRINVHAILADGFAADAQVVIIPLPQDRKPYRVLLWDSDDGLRSSEPRERSP